MSLFALALIEAIQPCRDVRRADSASMHFTSAMTRSVRGNQATGLYYEIVHSCAAQHVMSASKPHCRRMDAPRAEHVFNVVQSSPSMTGEASPTRVRRRYSP